MSTRDGASRGVAILALVSLAFAPGFAPMTNAGAMQKNVGNNGYDPFAPGSPPFIFSDSFYAENGIDPAALVGVKTGEDGLSVPEKSPDGGDTRGDVRILATNGGYDAAGALLFYPDPPAALFESGFTDDAAGDAARAIAEEFRAFIFPRAGGNPFSPAPPNRRQDNLFDTTMGYLTDNPLGLWRLTFVRYTDDALNTAAGQAALQVYAERNGLDDDGTPLLKRKHEIEALVDAGWVELYTRDEEGTNGPPWVV